MNKKLHLIVLLFITVIGYSQVSKNYKQLSNEDNANYYTIVADARTEFATKDLTILANKKANKQFERWAYHWENKVNQDGIFPNENTGYFNAGILNVKGKLTGNTTANRGALSSQAWTNISPTQADINNNGYSNYPQMGRLNAFLRIKHPTNINQDVLFVGAPGGGIWKSTDGGANWTPKLDQVAGIGVTDIKTVPGTTTDNYTTQPIYVSTGDWDGGHVKSIGVLKSTDGGETFSSTGLSYTLDQQKVTGDLVVFDVNTVLVGGSQFIKKTIDGGTTWTNTHDTQSGNGNPGRVAVNGNEVIYTGLWDLYYTSDYTTDNWVAITGTTQNRRAVTVDQNGDFYIQNQDGQVQLYNTANNTLSDVGNIPSDYNSQGGYNQALVVNNDMMVTGEFNGQSSTDGGTNWYRSLNGYWSNSSSPGTYIHSDHHRMGQLDSNLELWSVNDGGLSYATYSSESDQHPTIDYKSGNVIVTQSYSVAINPSASDGAIVAANQDNDAFSKTNDQWYAVAMGDGIQGAVNYNNPMIRYAGNQGGYVSQTDTGFIGQLQGNGNTVQIPGASFYFPLEMDKANPNILYGGGDDVYKLDATNGLTIAATNAGFTGNITSISTHGIITVASSATEFRYTTNSAASWNSFSNPNAGGGNITSVDLGDGGGTLYATRGGYSATNKVQRYRSSWVDITGDLPNIVVNEIMRKQNQANNVEILFLATELGVYYTQIENNDVSNIQWSKLGQGMPNVNVKDIEIHYTEDKLIAGTFGRGLWEINIANATLGTTSFENELAGISVYPNPAVNSINIKLPNNDNYKYLIYNVVGGTVKTGELNNNNPIDVSNLEKNIYMIRIYNDTSSITKKIILK